MKQPATWVGVGFLLLAIILAVAIKEPSDLLTYLILALFALGGGAFATEILGLLNIQWSFGQRLSIGAAGAIGVFVMLFFGPRLASYFGASPNVASAPDTYEFRIFTVDDRIECELNGNEIGHTNTHAPKTTKHVRDPHPTFMTKRTPSLDKLSKVLPFAERASFVFNPARFGLCPTQWMTRSKTRALCGTISIGAITESLPPLPSTKARTA
jgi:hypothetical protein